MYRTEQAANILDLKKSPLKQCFKDGKIDIRVSFCHISTHASFLFPIFSCENKASHDFR